MRLCVETNKNIIFYLMIIICCCAAGVNCLAYDEAIMAQQDRIQQEVS